MNAANNVDTFRVGNSILTAEQFEAEIERHNAWSLAGEPTDWAICPDGSVIDLSFLNQ